MDPTDITLADFQPHELGPKADSFSVLLAVVERATEKLAAKISEETVPGGGSAHPAKRRKTLVRTLRPDEGLIDTIRAVSLDRGIAQPPPPKLVIQKQLFATDLSPSHNRLSIPISQIADDFLTEAEKQRLRSENKLTNYLEVKIMAAHEAAMSLETVKLSRWDMRKGRGRKTSSIYAINGKWNAFVEKNKLRAGMVVQLWCFRLQRELCFALVRLPDSSVSASASVSVSAST